MLNFVIDFGKKKMWKEIITSIFKLYPVFQATPMKKYDLMNQINARGTYLV